MHCSRDIIVLHNCSDESVIVPCTSSSNGKLSAGQSRSEQSLCKSLVLEVEGVN